MRIVRNTGRVTYHTKYIDRIQSACGSWEAAVKMFLWIFINRPQIKYFCFCEFEGAPVMDDQYFPRFRRHPTRLSHLSLLQELVELHLQELLSQLGHMGLVWPELHPSLRSPLVHYPLIISLAPESTASASQFFHRNFDWIYVTHETLRIFVQLCRRDHPRVFLFTNALWRSAFRSRKPYEAAYHFDGNLWVLTLVSLLPLRHSLLVYQYHKYSVDALLCLILISG